MNIRRIINEEIQKIIKENFYNENFYNENSFFERRKKRKSDSEIDDFTKDNNKKDKKKKRGKKRHQMASESLMERLREYYRNNKDALDLRASVANVYNMSTDTTSSKKNTVKLNSRTSAVRAALNGEVRPDNGIPYSLRQDIAQKLLDFWTSGVN